MSSAPRLPRRWTGGAEPTADLLAAHGILGTSPIAHDPKGPLLVAGIGTRQVLPLLVAAKSLCHSLGRGRVALVDDGTLTAEDRGLLAHHLDDPVIHTARAENAPFPDGFGWAALAVITGRHQADYRIFLDLEFVTAEISDQVREALARNRSFLGPDARGAIGLAAIGAGPAEARALVTRFPKERIEAPDAPRRFAWTLALNEPGAVELPASIGVQATPETVLQVVAGLPR